MFTEDYVSFETAKLLKQKGFDEACTLSHFDLDAYKKWFETAPRPITIDADSEKPFRYPVPTLQMAMKWLRETHKLGVFPTTYYREINRNAKHDYGSTIVMLDTYEVIGNGKNIEDYTFEAETYEETAEKAIRYCLENLI